MGVTLRSLTPYQVTLSDFIGRHVNGDSERNCFPTKDGSCIDRVANFRSRSDMKANYDRSISLQCPTCGGADFEHDETEHVKCVRCERTLTKSELQEANGARIETEIEELKSEVLKDVHADLKKAFSKWK